MTAPAASPAIGAPNGALFFPLLLLATAVTFVLFPLASHVFPETASLTELTVWVMFVGSGGHVAASFFFYTDREIREKLLFPQRGRFFLVPVAIVLGSALFFSFTGPVVAAWGSTAYWVWQTHHYARQNHGILAFASRAGGVPVTQLERTALTLAGVAGVIGMTTFVTPIAETGLLAWGWYLHTVGLGVYAAAWVCYGLSLLQRAPALDMRSLMLLVLMLFFGPLFLFSDPLSAVFTYAIAHGLQYLVFMGFVVSGRRALAGFGVLAAFVLLGGGLLYAFMRPDGQLGISPEPFFGAYLGIVMWHFLLDAGVWRLSDPFQRSYMARHFDFLR